MKKFVFKKIIIIVVFLALMTSSSSAYTDKVFAKTSESEMLVFPILMYHSTCKNKPSKYNIQPNDFERDLIYLNKMGYTTITIADLINFKKGASLPQKPVMLTFDDGYMNNYFNIFPLLKKYKTKCIMSVIGNLTDANYSKNLELTMTWSHLTYEQMKEMSDSGLVEIQNHTYSMHDFGKKTGRYGIKKKQGESSELYEKNLTENLTKLQNKLIQRVGTTCTAVAYPFGAYSKEAIDITKNLGFSAAFTCNERYAKISRDMDFFLLNRYNRDGNVSTDAFMKKIDII